MSTITKEQAKDLRNAFDCWQQDYDPVEDKEQYDMFGLGMVAMDALLASLEAEPVGEIVLGEYDDSGCHPDARVACIAADGQADWGNFKDGTRLYAAPPLPAEIDERDAFNAWNNDENLPIAGVGAKNAAWLAWQARAKLYSPPAPVFVPDEATPDNIEILASTYAPSGVTYQWDDDECNSAADSWNACRAAMLQGADGNSPVIPDGWVACSERMPEDGEKVLTSFRGGVRTAVCKVIDVLGHKIFVDDLTLFNGVPADHWQPLPAVPKLE